MALQLHGCVDEPPYEVQEFIQSYHEQLEDVELQLHEILLL